MGDHCHMWTHDTLYLTVSDLWFWSKADNTVTTDVLRSWYNNISEKHLMLTLGEWIQASFSWIVENGWKFHKREYFDGIFSSWSWLKDLVWVIKSFLPLDKQNWTNNFLILIIGSWSLGSLCVDDSSWAGLEMLSAQHWLIHCSHWPVTHCWTPPPHV